VTSGVSFAGASGRAILIMRIWGIESWVGVKRSLTWSPFLRVSRATLSLPLNTRVRSVKTKAAEPLVVVSVISRRLRSMESMVPPARGALGSGSAAGVAARDAAEDASSRATMTDRQITSA